VNDFFQNMQAMDIRPDIGERFYANLGDMVETILSKTQVTPELFDAVPKVYACGVSSCVHRVYAHARYAGM
jgi:hypothetical protein